MKSWVRSLSLERYRTSATAQKIKFIWSVSGDLILKTTSLYFRLLISLKIHSYAQECQSWGTSITCAVAWSVNLQNYKIDVNVLYKYIHIYIHTHIHTYVHIYVRTHTRGYIHTHIYVSTYVYTYVHTHTHTYIHTYTHTYVHIYSLNFNREHRFIFVSIAYNIRGVVNSSCLYLSTNSIAIVIFVHTQWPINSHGLCKIC
jgi:hypothetical protein